MNLTVQGKVALVTGGGRGIGKAVARVLAQAGAYVIITYRTSEKEAQGLVREITDIGGRAEALRADISEESEVAKLFESIESAQGKLDIAVLNAGITKSNLLRMTSINEFDELIKTNARSVFLCMRAALGIMSKQHSGKIISISSIVGVRGNRGQAAYAASKAAILGLTFSVAKEAGSSGVTVNAIAPGFIDTDMTASLTNETRAAIIAQNPLGRFGTPEEVAHAVLFLASPLSDYINGQVLSVDGGHIL